MQKEYFHECKVDKKKDALNKIQATRRKILSISLH